MHQCCKRHADRQERCQGSPLAGPGQDFGAPDTGNPRQSDLNDGERQRQGEREGTGFGDHVVPPAALLTAGLS